MQLAILTHCAYHRGIGWNNCMVIGRGSTVSGLMGNGVYVFAGRGVMPSMLRLWTIIEEGSALRTEDLIRPGEIVREEFLRPLGISQNKLALDLHIPATRIGDIVHERRGITADTAIRLGIYFRTGAEFWTNLQANYDMGVLLRDKHEEFAQIQAMA